MNRLMIDFDKFEKLRDAIPRTPGYSFDYYRCKVFINLGVSYDEKDIIIRDEVALEFDNEEDVIWFKLKHL